MKLNSKTRTLNSIKHEEPDRVPIDFWSTKETDAKLLKHLNLKSREELLEYFDVDFRYIKGPDYIGPELKRYADGSEEDIWGVPRKIEYAGNGDKRQSYKAVTHPPLAFANNIKDVENYDHWPSMDWLDFSKISSQCDECQDKAVLFMGDRLNRIAQWKPAQYLRGMEQVMMDMVINEPVFEAIIERTRVFYQTYLEKILQKAEGKIDIIVTGDDFGTQNGLMCSPEMWRKFFKKGFKAFIDIAKKYDVPVLHHTCGSVYDIIPDMIDCRLSILNPLQPGTKNMEHQKLKREFGNDLCFHGSVSIQTNLPFGTPSDVKKEVKECVENLASRGGFFICTAHNIQADTPVENILALIEAYHEYGKY
ncbi:hypothetical protein KAW08_06330 [bacterium]|nr:hypothetical protein [bacterium]